jgi:hypothetical protein
MKLAILTCNSLNCLTLSNFVTLGYVASSLTFRSWEERAMMLKSFDHVAGLGFFDVATKIDPHSCDGFLNYNMVKEKCKLS